MAGGVLIVVLVLLAVFAPVDPAVATAVRLAVDGWWLAGLVDLAPPPPGLHERVYAVLTGLVEASR